LRASSDTLPTPLNLRRWHIQTGATCSLCLSPHPTCHHVLNGFPVALQQSRFIFRHDAVLSCLMAGLQACLDDVEIFADLDGKRASDSRYSLCLHMPSFLGPHITLPCVLIYACVKIAF